jgi:hypothetical protein
MNQKGFTNHMPNELLDEFQHFLLMADVTKLNRLLRMLFLQYCDHFDKEIPNEFSELIMEMSQLFEFIDKMEDLSPYTEERYLGKT